MACDILSCYVLAYLVMSKFLNFYVKGVNVNWTYVTFKNLLEKKTVSRPSGFVDQNMNLRSHAAT